MRNGRRKGRDQDKENKYPHIYNTTTSSFSPCVARVKREELSDTFLLRCTLSHAVYYT